ncbi:Oligoribonuclease, mitochondrial [Armadillidium vulgare]|nr:Oligoribonuclease, mitochondrial [Armadillidium vulgare]
MRRSMASAASDSETPSKFMKVDERLVWVDLEMTGLNTDKDRIMEAAVIVTDSNLDVIREGPNLVIKVDDGTLDNMNEWCKKHHGESGLTEACRKSDVTLQMAEDRILEFLVQHTEQGKAPLAGNSVHADKKFLDKYMPKLMKHLHYRIVDVSTVKELCRRWYPTEFTNAPKKKVCHRALDDIRESIDELKYYKTTVFK